MGYAVAMAVSSDDDILLMERWYAHRTQCRDLFNALLAQASVLRQRDPEALEVVDPAMVRLLQQFHEYEEASRADLPRPTPDQVDSVRRAIERMEKLWPALRSALWQMIQQVTSDRAQ